MSDSPAPQSAVTVTGTPDAPNLRRRPIVLLAFMVLYAAFIALLIVWSLRLHRG